MQYYSNMSTEKDDLSSLNEIKRERDHYFPAGHVSPSSWDDSNEEQSDEDSSTTEKFQNKEKMSCDSFISEIITEDRRQSLARVRRRTRSSSSSVFDIDNVKGKDSSESCDESVNSSAKPDTQKYRETTSPDFSPVHQCWNDWDSEEIILGIENYLNKKRFSLIRSKTFSNHSNINEYVSVLNGVCGNQTEMREDCIDCGSDLNSKLSKITEVEENRSNMTSSCRTNETPSSAISVCSQTDANLVEYTAAGITNPSYHDIESKAEISNIIPYNDRDHIIVPMKYSSKDNHVNVTDEEDSDDSDIWTKIRSKTQKNNCEYAMNDEDCEYINRSLKFIFHKREPPNPSNVEEDLLDLGDNKGQVLVSTLKEEKFKNEVHVDETGENRNDERAGESISLSCFADLSERTLNNASSKLKNPFCAGQIIPLFPSTENHRVDRNGGIEMQDDVIRYIPRSGREAFLAQESSIGGNSPSDKFGSKRVRNNHTISISTRKKSTDYLEVMDQAVYCNENRGRNSPQGAYAEQKVPVEEESKTRQNNTRKKADLYPNASSKPPFDNSDWIKNAGYKDEAVKSEDNGRSSSASFGSEILLDLDLSDNEEKCSTVERLIFGDSPEYINKCVTPSNVESETGTFLRNSTAVTKKTTEIGKSGRRPSAESHKRNNSMHSHNYDQYGIGDSKWNNNKTEGKKFDFPQDRGDVKYESCDTKQDWGKLIMSLEGTSPVRSKGTKNSVFWIDICGNSPGIMEDSWQRENYRDSDFFLPEKENRLIQRKMSFENTSKWIINTNESSNSFPKKSNINSQFSSTKRAKFRPAYGKKKMENVSAMYGNSVPQGFDEIGLESHTRWGDRLFDRRGNWLVNTVTRREDMLTRGKRWVQTFVVNRKRGGRTGSYRLSSTQPISQISSKPTDCFCYLFKQFVNVFTVPRKSKK